MSGIDVAQAKFHLILYLDYPWSLLLVVLPLVESATNSTTRPTRGGLRVFRPLKYLPCLCWEVRGLGCAWVCAQATTTGSVAANLGATSARVNWPGEALSGHPEGIVRRQRATCPHQVPRYHVSARAVCR